MPDKFENVPVMVLPQDIKNDVDDPTEMVQQLVISYQTSVADKETFELKVDDLQNENEHLSAQVKIKDEWYRTIDQRLKATEAELSKLQREPNEKVKEMEIQVNEHMTLVSAMTHCEAESIPTMQEEIHNLKMKLELAKAEKRTLEQEQETTTVVMNKLTDEIEDLLTFKVQAQSKIATTEQQKCQFQELRAENIKLRQRLINTTDNVDNPKNVENTGYAEDVTLREYEENKNKAEEQLSRKQEECNQLMQELDEAQNTLSNLNKDHKAKVTAVEKMTLEKDDLLNRMKDCQEKLSAKTREAEALGQQVDESRNENSKLRKELTINGNEIAQLTGERDEIRNTSEKMLAAKIKEEQKSQQQLQKSTYEISRLKEDQKFKSAAIKKLASEKQKLQTQLQHYEDFVMVETTAKHQKLVQHLEESQTERERLEYEKAELGNENEKLQDKVKDCEECVAAQNIEKQKLFEQVEMLQAEKIEFKKDYEATTSELETLSMEKEELQRRVKDFEATINSKSMQIESISQWTLHHGKMP